MLKEDILALIRQLGNRDYLREVGLSQYSRLLGTNIPLWVQALDSCGENPVDCIVMDDMFALYDILATATEYGNELARELMNEIWEPEQIIEED